MQFRRLSVMIPAAALLLATVGLAAAGSFTDVSDSSVFAADIE